MPERAIRRLRKRNRALREDRDALAREAAGLRRDLGAAAGYARELQDRLLDEISRCSELRAERDAALGNVPGDAADVGAGG